jgi:hypothetical protein
VEEKGVIGQLIPFIEILNGKNIGFFDKKSLICLKERDRITIIINQNRKIFTRKRRIFYKKIAFLLNNY